MGRQTPLLGTQTMADTEKWKELCGKAAVEKDPQRLLELVQEINRILEEIENKEKSPAIVFSEDGDRG